MADFNQDGYQDILFVTDSTAWVLTAVCTNDPLAQRCDVFVSEISLASDSFSSPTWPVSFLLSVLIRLSISSSA